MLYLIKQQRCEICEGRHDLCVPDESPEGKEYWFDCPKKTKEKVPTVARLTCRT